MSKHNIKKGQKAWVILSGRNNDVNEVEVTKVGTKWITVNLGYGREIRFESDTLMQEIGYGARGMMYLSLQDIEDEKEFTKLSTRTQQQFGSYSTSHRKKLTLDQMRRIVSIIDEDGTTKNN